jgi:hypothetical protein
MFARFFYVFILAAFVKSDDNIDPKKQASADVALGMQGLSEASSDPAVLAQLLQDMNVSRVADISLYRAFLGTSISHRPIFDVLESRACGGGQENDG